MDEKLITLLEKIVEELSGIGRSASALAMLCEDGYLRPSVTIENIEIERGIKKSKGARKV